MKNNKIKIGLVIAAVIIMVAIFAKFQNTGSDSVYDQETFDQKYIKNTDKQDKGKNAAKRIFDQEEVNPDLIKNTDK